MVRVYILFKNIIWSILLSTLENFQYKLERNIHFIVLGVFYKYYFVQKSWQYCSNPSYSCWYLCLYICSISHWEWDIKKMLNYDRGFDFIFVLQILILFLLGEYTFKICLPDELTLLSLWNVPVVNTLLSWSLFYLMLLWMLQPPNAYWLYGISLSINLLLICLYLYI